MPVCPPRVVAAAVTWQLGLGEYGSVMRAGAIRQPREPERMTRVVVIAGDVVAVGQPAPALRDEVDADVRPAALQVPAEVQPAADARLDDAIAEELHVALPLSRTHAGPEIRSGTWPRCTATMKSPSLRGAVAAAASAAAAATAARRRRRGRGAAAGHEICGRRPRPLVLRVGRADTPEEGGGGRKAAGGRAGLPSTLAGPTSPDDGGEAVVAGHLEAVADGPDRP